MSGRNTRYSFREKRKGRASDRPTPPQHSDQVVEHVRIGSPNIPWAPIREPSIGNYCWYEERLAEELDCEPFHERVHTVRDMPDGGYALMLKEPYASTVKVFRERSWSQASEHDWSCTFGDCIFYRPDPNDLEESTVASASTDPITYTVMRYPSRLPDGDQWSYSYGPKIIGYIRKAGFEDPPEEDEFEWRDERVGPGQIHRMRHSGTPNLRIVRPSEEPAKYQIGNTMETAIDLDNDKEYSALEQRRRKGKAKMVIPPSFDLRTGYLLDVPTLPSQPAEHSSLPGYTDSSALQNTAVNSPFRLGPNSLAELPAAMPTSSLPAQDAVPNPDPLEGLTFPLDPNDFPELGHPFDLEPTPVEMSLRASLNTARVLLYRSQAALATRIAFPEPDPLAQEFTQSLRQDIFRKARSFLYNTKGMVDGDEYNQTLLFGEKQGEENERQLHESINADLGKAYKVCPELWYERSCGEVEPMPESGQLDLGDGSNEDEAEE